MAHELDDISRLLGSLEESVKGLSRRFERHEARAEERDAVIGEMQDTAAAMASDVRYMRAMIDTDIKPVTDDVKRWRLMGLGALGVIGLGGATVGGFVLWVAGQLGWVKLP